MPNQTTKQAAPNGTNQNKSGGGALGMLMLIGIAAAFAIGLQLSRYGSRVEQENLQTEPAAWSNSTYGEKLIQEDAPISAELFEWEASDEGENREPDSEEEIDRNGVAGSNEGNPSDGDTVEEHGGDEDTDPEEGNDTDEDTDPEEGNDTNEEIAPEDETYEENPADADDVPLWQENPLLILVNREHPLPEGYEPDLTRIGNRDRYIMTVAYEDLCAMLDAGESEGFRFEICSAYRSVAMQQQLYDADIDSYMAKGMSYEEAKAATERYTMPPGCSEHSTGLALDIVAVSNQRLDDSQEYTKETQWLHENCWKYGFILRYPKGRGEITGIAYESWHYRYVGQEVAEYITENDLTLEEYLRMLNG